MTSGLKISDHKQKPNVMATKKWKSAKEEVKAENNHCLEALLSTFENISELRL